MTPFNVRYPRRSRVLAAAALLAGMAGIAGSIVLAGCETTAQKSARLKREGVHKIADQRGLTITRVNTSVKVLSTAVLHDQNGTAAVVILRNDSNQRLVNVPIAINVMDARGMTLFRNDTPGLQASLVSVPVLEPHARFVWVNDQVQATGTPAKVTAMIGASLPHPGVVPQLSVSGISLFVDPVSGAGTEGNVTNHSTVDQAKLVIFSVAAKGSRIVAAGRAILPKVHPGKSAHFQVFYIGNPRGAQAEFAAPAVNLGA